MKAKNRMVIVSKILHDATFQVHLKAQHIDRGNKEAHEYFENGRPLLPVGFDFKVEK